MNIRSLVGAAAAGATLLLAGCGSSSADTTSSPVAPVISPSASMSAAAVSNAPAGAVPVTLADFMITVPATLPAGQVSFAVTNAGPTPHQFTVEDATGRAVGATAPLAPQSSAVLTVRLTAGTYSYLCALPGHASLGMHGSFTVS